MDNLCSNIFVNWNPFNTFNCVLCKRDDNSEVYNTLRKVENISIKSLKNSNNVLSVY